ncbi:Bacterial regulatory protein, tetR family [compost metagenome]
MTAEPAAGVRRGRPKVSSDEQQAAAVVAEARRIFIEQGYERMTMDGIAARCRMSKRTIYQLFASKQAVMKAVIEDHRAQIFGLPGDYDGLPLEEALSQIFRINVDGDDDLQRWAVLRAIKAEAAKSEELLAIIRANTADLIPAMLADWIAEQAGRGRIVVPDPARAAKILLDMVFGCVFDKNGRLCEWPDAEDRRVYMRDCISIFVNGCRSR